IAENPQLGILDLDDGGAVRQGPVYARLRELNVGDRLARQWIAEYGESYVGSKLDYMAGQGGIKSPTRYLSAALSRDFRSETPEAVEVPRNPRADRLRQVQQAVASRSPTQRDADRRLFASGLADEALRADFERHGWMSPLNAEAISVFWEGLMPDLFSELEGAGEP
ncbi:MAG: replication initiation protein, partial [Pseudomonadota bacterium]